MNPKAPITLSPRWSPDPGGGRHLQAPILTKITLSVREEMYLYRGPRVTQGDQNESGASPAQDYIRIWTPILRHLGCTMQTRMNVGSQSHPKCYHLDRAGGQG
jgi:hypothetical protein